MFTPLLATCVQATASNEKSFVFWAFKTLAFTQSYATFYDSFWAQHPKHASLEHPLKVTLDQTLNNQGFGFGNDVWTAPLLFHL